MQNDPRNIKLAAYLRARPTATDEQLTQYLVFHCGTQWDHARGIVAELRKEQALSEAMPTLPDPAPVAKKSRRKAA